MSIEAMKQALEALEITAMACPDQREAITSLRAAIVQAESASIEAAEKVKEEPFDDFNFKSQNEKGE